MFLNNRVENHDLLYWDDYLITKSYSSIFD